MMSPHQNQTVTIDIFRRRTDEWSRAILRGGSASLLLLLTIAVITMAGLFATVHRQSEESIKRNVPPRYRELMTFWKERGYIKHGGLWVRSPADPENWAPPGPQEPVRYVYRSPMTYLLAPYVAERLSWAVRGHYSESLMRVMNQAVVGIAAALLGLLAMRLARHIGATGLHALMLGIAAQMVYQTFPVNLWNVWEIYPTTVVACFALGFALTTASILSRERESPWLLRSRALCVFGMFAIDYPAASLMLPAYLITTTALGFPLRRQHVLKTLILPAAAAFALLLGQIAIIKLNYPAIQFIGSPPLFRTGFDGSRLYYFDHWDLFAGRRSMFAFLKWPSLFGAGCAACGLLVALYHRIPELRLPVAIIAITLGLYVPFAFVFSQAAVIHPYEFDSYLIIPVCLSVFAAAPAVLERVTGNKGIFALVFFAAGFCYVMVQLRAYALQYPL